MSEEIINSINQATDSGDLLDSSKENILKTLKTTTSQVTRSSIKELVNRSQWSELNDRFFRTLAFGTGGLRGRTIGNVVTEPEQGIPTGLGRPEFPCTGTNAVNYYNISRATQGLCKYAKDWFAKNDGEGKPSIVLAHDPRHFSRDFAELAAKIAVENGVDAYLFESARSTPQLSFALRYLGATVGVVITASHNPPHDNGFKVYFSDGAQVVEPNASGIIEEVNAIVTEDYEPVPDSEQGELKMLGEEMDNAYMDRLEGLLLQPELVKQLSGFKVVFTAIHGTGGIICEPMLQRLGFDYVAEPTQALQDGRFPTVKSPNPENAEALAMAIDLAKKENADLVIATDPDADRMGVAVRTASGEMKLLSGNQLGSLMAYYRLTTMIDQGIITEENKSKAVIIKTIVTTDLQKAIAEHHGVRCVETLTGFKYIGEKLQKYEQQIPTELREDYMNLSEEETRKLRFEHSSVYIFGGEESYGYSGSDYVRDKDANGSVVIFAEVAAYAKSKGMTVDELLDEVYKTYGLYTEKNASLVFEGAEGAGKIAALAGSYAENPPTEIAGSKVTKIQNFATDDIYDVEGDMLPKEKVLIFELEDGCRIAVRPSGTEPKIKYYLFAKSTPDEGAKFSDEELDSLKSELTTRLDNLWKVMESDAHDRVS